MTTLYILLAVALVALIVLVVLFLRQEEESQGRRRSAGRTRGRRAETRFRCWCAPPKPSSPPPSSSRAPGSATCPVYLLMGESGSAKTSVMIHSGLDPELLAGQVYQDAERGAHAGRQLLVLAALHLRRGGRQPAGGPGQWNRLVRRLQPRSSVVGKGGQAPRAAVVCFDCETFTRAGAQEAAVNAARDLAGPPGRDLPGARHQSPGLRAVHQDGPAAVLHRVRAQPEQRRSHPGARRDSPHAHRPQRRRVRRRGDRAPDAALRAAVPIAGGCAAGVPGARDRRREAARHLRVSARVPQDPARRGAVPGGPVPAQPVERGARSARILLHRRAADHRQRSRPGRRGRAAAAGAATDRPPAPPAFSTSGARWRRPRRPRRRRWAARARCRNGSSSATCSTMFCWPTGPPWAPAAPAPRPASRAACCSLAAAVLCLAALASVFTVSFFNNRGLETRVRDARRRAFRPPTSAGADLAPVDSPAETGDAPPVARDAGASTGAKALRCPTAWASMSATISIPKRGAIYFDRFRQLLFAQTQDSILQNLRGLPATPGPEYTPTYDALKAYLITTSHHEKSTRQFLSPVLMKWWANGRAVDPGTPAAGPEAVRFLRRRTARKRIRTPRRTTPPRSRQARRYLTQFAGRRAGLRFHAVGSRQEQSRPSTSIGSSPVRRQVVMETARSARRVFQGRLGLHEGRHRTRRPVLQRRAVGAGRPGCRATSIAPSWSRICAPATTPISCSSGGPTSSRPRWSATPV